MGGGGDIFLHVFAGRLISVFSHPNAERNSEKGPRSFVKLIILVSGVYPALNFVFVLFCFSFGEQLYLL